MYAFSQVEKFLDKEITKNPLPEGCGEGPEYVTSKRKASAKSNRRKDRDATSHKANKQRNRRNTRKDRQPKARSKPRESSNPSATSRPRTEAVNSKARRLAQKEQRQQKAQQPPSAKATRRAG